MANYHLIDVNECLTNNGGCDQFCQNTIASYVCSCGDGYTLQNDSYTCEGEMIMIPIITYTHSICVLNLGFVICIGN